MRLSNIEAKKELHKLRWPSTNGKPICPKCGSKREPNTKSQRLDFFCRDCKKSFNYKTMSPFIFAQIEDWQILSLIESVKNEVKHSEAAKLAGIKIDTARKWISKINDEFSEGDDGKLYFPEPNIKYEYREKNRTSKRKDTSKKITKNQVALYILKHKYVIMSQFEKEFCGYDLTGSMQFINSLLNKTKDQLKLISRGKDPFKESSEEMNNIREKIYEKEKQQFDKIKIPNFNDTDTDFISDGV